MKGQCRVSGWLQPGLFAWKVAPSPVRILSRPQSIQTRAKVKISHMERIGSFGRNLDGLVLAPGGTI